MKIGIAEPRRFCATTLARRVAEEQGCKIGTTVGYCIRFDDCQDPKLTKVKVSIIFNFKLNLTSFVQLSNCIFFFFFST